MSPLTAWICLIFAGISEILWAYFLKQSDGFSKIFPSSMFVLTLMVSMILLAFAVKVIPIGIAYPIWTGIGAVGSVLIGVIFFGEILNWRVAIFLLMIICGIIGLKFLQS
jgi:quaternary ammonium compound-resistance protein SugE